MAKSGEVMLGGQAHSGDVPAMGQSEEIQVIGWCTTSICVSGTAPHSYVSQVYLRVFPASAFTQILVEFSVAAAGKRLHNQGSSRCSRPLQ